MIRSFNGKTPRVDPTAFVSEAAYVVGDVEIGPYSSVWPGVVIRGDMGRITIGSHTNIQDNSVVHSDTDATLGDYVTLGHSVVCHAARVEDYALLGKQVRDQRRGHHPRSLHRRRRGRGACGEGGAVPLHHRRHAGPGPGAGDAATPGDDAGDRGTTTWRWGSGSRPRGWSRPR